MQTDPRDEPQDIKKKAEAFIEKVVAPARRANPDAETARAKGEFEKENRELARKELAAAGFDVERLDKLVSERETKRKQLVEESRRRAIDTSALTAEQLRGLLVHIPPLDPIDTVIDQMTFIRTFVHQGELLDSNIAPSDNWAKYRLDWDNTGPNLSDGRLSFFALWQNKRSTPTIITVKPNLVMNSRLSCDVGGNGPGSWFGMTSQATATVRARTTVWSMASNVGSIVHDEALGSVAARGHFFGDDSSKSIATNRELSATAVSVGPDAFVLIEVELLTEWQAVGGSVTFDAESGSHRIDVPYITLTQQQVEEPPAPAPISLTAGVDTGVSPARVTLIFAGANGALVDIYQNGTRLGDTENDGVWSIEPGPGTYTYRVCETQSSVCSMEVTVTVP